MRRGLWRKLLQSNAVISPLPSSWFDTETTQGGSSPHQPAGTLALLPSACTCGEGYPAGVPGQRSNPRGAPAGGSGVSRSIAGAGTQRPAQRPGGAEFSRELARRLEVADRLVSLRRSARSPAPPVRCQGNQVTRGSRRSGLL